MSSAGNLRKSEASDRTNSFNQDKYYELKVSDGVALFLCVTPTSYSIVWPGAVEFSRLEHEAVCSLSAVLTEGEICLDLEKENTRRGVLASFIVPDGEPGLFEYKLDNPGDYLEYKRMLNEPEIISFARYDIEPAGEGLPFNYSFTAENPIFSANHRNELAIRLPKPHPFPKSLLEWVLRRHSTSASLKAEIDFRFALDRIHKLITEQGKVAIETPDSTAGQAGMRTASAQTEEVEAGQTYLGTVTRIVPFGAFVEIFPGVEGLLHISEIADHHVRDVRDELTEGQEILVKCISVKGAKIRLSRKRINFHGPRNNG